MNGESPRLLLTGGGGLLGGTLLRAAPAGWDLHATQRARPVEGAEAHSIELSDASAVEGLVARLRPTLMIHAAASMTEGARDIVAATASIVAACAAVVGALSRNPSAIATIRLRRSSSEAPVTSMPRVPSRSRTSATCSSLSSLGSRPR